MQEEHRLRRAQDGARRVQIEEHRMVQEQLKLGMVQVQHRMVQEKHKLKRAQDGARKVQIGHHGASTAQNGANCRSAQMSARRAQTTH